MRKFLIINVLLVLCACASQPSEQQLQQEAGFDPVEAAKTRISLGLTYLKNDNYKQAKFNLDKALQFAPNLADTHLGLGYYYQLVGDNDKADQAYNQAMQLKPKDADIANSYGAFLCQIGDYPRAKKYFLQAIASPSYIRVAETYENLALCSQNEGLKQESIQYLESALKHDPGRLKSIVMLIQLLIEDQNWIKAKQRLLEYEKAGSVSADTIWFWVQIEKGLGQEDRSQAYGKMLVQMYPGHPNTQKFLAMMKQQSLPTRTPKPFTDVIREQAPTPEAASASAETVPQAEDQTQADDAKYHQVEAGENLYRISLKYNIRMDKLLEWNHLSDAGAIYPGMKLRVNAPK
ncbi:type IV pilus biogenesis/stability protein PilW [Neptunicella sp. SCSIO 80796]|uniref:type IV pilus biogenesis/stability protein PilW n=1 Tax=Neptunicella plasticusilytica TaxID=3117012 RepID=UPI003A4E4B97